MTTSFIELADTIKALPSKNTQKLIGIDGGTNAGKSRFAKYLQGHLPGSEIISIDSFYIEQANKRVDVHIDTVSGDFDWERLETEVFKPLQAGNPITYQAYDWNTKRIVSSVMVPANAVILLEGVEALQRRFVDLYDFKIWIECPASLRLARAVKREGEHMRRQFEELWIPFDETYKELHQVIKEADIIVRGEDVSPDHFTRLK